jgi:Rieske Fe-S protein
MASNEGPKPKPVARRDFLGIAVGASGAAFVVAAGRPLRKYVEPPTRPFSGVKEVGKLEDFPEGTAKTVLIDEHPVLIVRTVKGEFRAYSAICTHLQCVVTFSAEHNQIECPCHGGIYSLDGQNVAGPPPRPLDELNVTINERTIVVSSRT